MEELTIEELQMLHRKLGAAFPFGKLQDILILMGVLAREGISLKVLKAYVDQTREANERRIRMRNLSEEMKKEIAELNISFSKKCPNCDINLMLSPLPKDNENGKSKWTCNECKYEEFDERSMQEIDYEYWMQFDEIIKDKEKPDA